MKCNGEAGRSQPISAVVVGLGPAGQIFAHRAKSRGWNLDAFDPRGKNLPNTIGLWKRQLPNWVPANLIAASFCPTVVLADGSSRRFKEEYVVLRNTELLKLGGYKVHRESLSSSVLESTSTNADSSQPKSLCAGHALPDIVIDARGRYCASSTTDEGSPLPRQLAWGHIFPIDAVPSKARDAVLMDFRPITSPSSPIAESAGTSEEANGCLEHDQVRDGGCDVLQAPLESIPSFSYRIPVGGNSFLIEETILATDARHLSHREALALVKQRQLARLRMLGVNVDRALDREIVSFPLVRGSKKAAELEVSRCQGNEKLLYVPVGVAGDWMNPATGYSVGTAFEFCDQTLNALESSLHHGSSNLYARPPGGALLYAVRRRGLNALLSFTETEYTNFFAAFFSLSEKRILAYLVGDSFSQLAVTMMAVALPLAQRHPKLLAKLVKNFLL